MILIYIFENIVYLFLGVLSILEKGSYLIVSDHAWMVDIEVCESLLEMSVA